VANEEGAIAFTATLAGGGVSKSNSSAVFVRNAAGDLSSIARTGMSATGIPGTTWKRFVSFALPSGADAGVIFLAQISGTGVTNKNNLGLWAQDSTGELVLIARTGAAVPGASDGKVLSKLALLNPLPPAQGSERSYNDARRIAYLATFTDRSQAIEVARIP
jgi:hypothetical protein